MESIFSYIILFVLFIQCNSSSYENYLRVNLDIKNFCNNKKQSHDLNAYINKKEIIITKQYDLYTNFVEEYNTILKKKK